MTYNETKHLLMCDSYIANAVERKSDPRIVCMYQELVSPEEIQS